VKEVINTNGAAPAVGPYSQGIRAGQWVFSSGQIPTTPSGELVTADIAAATRQSLNNLRAVLEAAGAKTADVVKVTIFLIDIGELATVNSIYEEFFSAQPPARSCVQVTALPKGVPIMIEAIAHI